MADGVGVVPAPPYVQTSYGRELGTISWLISNVLKLVMTIGGLLTFAFFIIGAFYYITSGGEKDKIDKAQKTLTNAIIGLVILAVSWIVMRIIETVFGIDILTPRFYAPSE